MSERPSSYQAFFAELKRRNVFKVAAFYGGAAFVVLQVVDLVMPALNLPESVMTAAVVVTVLAFPIALAVTWVFDLTPGGVKRTDPAQSGELEAIVTLPAARRWPAGLLAMTGTALLAVGVWWTIERANTSGTDSGPGTSERPPSIAVLPFVNMSGGEENEYFSDGITEEILNALAQVPGLKVAARTSAFQFKDRQLDLREVGRQLNVASVLEGSVQRSGDDIRITAQLIDAESGFHIWSGKFDRQLVDIFAVEDEIARTIADTLRAPLGLEPASRLVSRATEDAEAYELYLQGQQMLGRRGASLLRAVSFYEHALARDPNFAAAHAGLAEAYALLPFYALGDWEEFLAKAEASARRALALDSTMARAHVALANVRRDLWDWDTAQAHYERAIELAPNDAEAQHQYAQFLSTVGRHQAAVAQTYIFVELDPLSPIVNAGQARTLMFVGRYQEAIRSLNKAIELDPNLGLAHLWLMWANLLTGRYDEAEQAARLGAALVGEDPARYATLVRAVQNPELKSEALSILGTATDEHWELSPGARAYWYTLLDEHELALDALTFVVDKGLGNVTFLSDAIVGPLRNDPRFQDLLERAGLAR
jgi:TolB-like protein/Tfp pilus assembly protein PilF